MTTHETFKKRVRARMAATGEKYTQARTALLHPHQPTQPAGWVSSPDVGDDSMLAATGHRWDEWVVIIDAGPGRDATHAEIAAWVEANSDIGPWWSQGVAVGYERITGKRLPGQMPDGTFSVSASRSLAVTTAQLRDLTEDDDTRAALLPDVTATRLSRPGVKSPRFAVTDSADGADLGVLLLRVDPAGAKAKLTVTHEKLPSRIAADAWKAFWTTWLAELDGVL